MMNMKQYLVLAVCALFSAQMAMASSGAQDKDESKRKDDKSKLPVTASTSAVPTSVAHSTTSSSSSASVSSVVPAAVTDDVYVRFMKTAQAKGAGAIQDYIAEHPDHITKYNVNTQNNLGETALHRATISSNSAMVARLLELKADVSIEDSREETPIFGARSKDVALLLINAKTDLSQKNQDGENCYQCMEDKNTREWGSSITKRAEFLVFLKAECEKQGLSVED